jgi:uncharacterized protein with GYD domain
MLWVSYGKVSQEGMKGMIANPQNREKAVAKMVEGLGGKLISYHLLLNGDIDYIIIADVPTDKFEENLLVNSMLVRASGAIESVTSVPAMRAADAETQMKKAQQMASAVLYEAPSKT